MKVDQMDRSPQHWTLAFNLWLAFTQLFISFGNPELQQHVGSDNYTLEFISIDCGLPANSTYTEPNTGINFISDDRFISSGVSKNIADELKSEYPQQMWNVRSFPDGMRNCYRIDIISGSKYLIRVNFLYGNYDGLNILPKFDLHLGSNWWVTVHITDASPYTVFEIIHIPPLRYINICLANIGSGIPFVSSIELRLLQIGSYVTESGSLALFSRLDLGSTSNQIYRFNYDYRDRFWYPYNPNGSRQLSVPVTTATIRPNIYDLPKVVMSTAATPLNASAPVDFWWQTNPSDEYYLYMHFTELEQLASNETRSFNIRLNGVVWSSNVEPAYQTANTIHSRSPSSGERIEISLEKTQKSTLPPILNAVELYRVKDFQRLDTNQEDVYAITSIKSTYEVMRNWQGDPCGPVEYTWIGLNCSDDDNNPPRITALDLSSSGLTGEIDPSIFELTMLEKLDLSNNSLNGEVPYFLSKLQSLKILNLDNNNLTGSLPPQLLEKSKKGLLALSVTQNPYLCESPPCNENKSANSKKRNIVVPLVASLCGVFTLLVTAAALFLTLKWRKSKYAREEAYRNDTSLQTKRQYSYSDIIEMTNNFNRILGKGGFGSVYLGCIDHTWVAVKILSPSSVQGNQQFQAEVKLLMRIHHRNLTSLIGYCNEETNKGLIYEYMVKGNLQEHLSGKDSKFGLLTWKDRFHIAVNAAQGLEYLHYGCKPPIIHRDVKSTNILLNEQFQAKLSDFGLSKMILIEGETHVSTVVAGTPGYLDPEYSASNRITEKSDVYSYGVVLLEIITGQAVFARNEEKTHISQWVRSMVGNGDISNIVDSRLHGDFDSNSAWKAVEVALACVSLNSNSRPTMSEVVSQLKECLAPELSQTNNSGFYTGDLGEVRMNASMEFTPLAR